MFRYRVIDRPFSDFPSMASIEEFLDGWASRGWRLVQMVDDADLQSVRFTFEQSDMPPPAGK